MKMKDQVYRRILRQNQHYSSIFLKLFIALFCFYLPLFSAPDLTIVGFLEPQGGIGKVPINIIETLKDIVSINIIQTSVQEQTEHQVPISVKMALSNSDKMPGKVALLTDLIWDHCRKPTSQIPKESIIKLAYSMLETTKIPSMWVKILNEEIDAVIVPDKAILKVYEESGVQIPIFVLPIPMILKSFYEHPIHPQEPSTPFVFGDASANKNPITLIEAFAKAFGNNPNVQLVMRAGRIFEETRNIVNHLTYQYGLTNVILEEGHLILNNYVDRLASFDCFVNLSRGEGFSFIPREALALGIPVITTDNTASMTICNSGFIRGVPTNKRGPPAPHYKLLFQEACGEQFDCEVDDVVAALSDVYDHYNEYIKKARKGRKWVKQYDSANYELQQLYLTLIKPKKVEMGNKNIIKNNVLITNDLNLYKKYKNVIRNN